MENDNTVLTKDIIDGIHYLKSRLYQSGIVRDIELLNKHPEMLHKNKRVLADICNRLDIDINQYNCDIDHNFIVDLKQRNSKILKSRFNNPIKTLFNLHYPADYRVIGFQRNGGDFNRKFRISEFDTNVHSVNYIYINSDFSSELYEDTTRVYLKSTPNLFKCYTYWDEGIDPKYNLDKDFVNEAIVYNGIHDIRLLEIIYKAQEYELNDGLLLLGSIVKQAKYMRDNYVSDDNEFSMILPSIHKIYYELVDHIDADLTRNEVIKLLNIIGEIFGCRFIILHKHRRVLNTEMSEYNDCDLLYITMGIKKGK